MTFRTAKSSSAFARGSVPRFHRRSKLGFKLILFFFTGTFWDTMYYIGAKAERAVRNSRRAMVRCVSGFFRALGRGIPRVFRFFGRAIANVCADIAAPFLKLGRSVKSLFVVIHSTKDRGFRYTMSRVRMFFKYGFLWNKPMIGRLVNYLLPAACLAVCIFTIGTMTNLNYALQVTYNGNTVGYVEDESVYDSARRIIQNRMVENTEQGWSTDAELKIAVVDEAEVSNQDAIAETLLSVSGEEIAEATGVYVGGTFYGATAAGDLIADAIEGVIQPQRDYAAQIELADGVEGDITVKFARDVELVEGVYPSASISSYEDLAARLTSGAAEDIYYTAVGGESASDVALKNGISLERLSELNGGAVDSVLTEGTRLLVAAGEPLLRVKSVRTVTRVETIAFETLLTRDSRFLVGYMATLTTGEEGERTVVSEIEYQDGVEIGENVISDVVTKEPVDQEIIIGVKAGDGSIVESGSGILAWPTGFGSYMYVSRGFTSYHFGVDIAAPIGTPLYAADDGVVTVSERTNVGYGYYIIIDHLNGMQTVYGHCSELLANVGDKVSKGQVIALMGSTGNSTGSHLHFETRINGSKVDPAIYLMDTDEAKAAGLELGTY